MSPDQCCFLPTKWNSITNRYVHRKLSFKAENLLRCDVFAPPAQTRRNFTIQISNLNISSRFSRCGKVEGTFTGEHLVDAQPSWELIQMTVDVNVVRIRNEEWRQTTIDTNTRGTFDPADPRKNKQLSAVYFLFVSCRWWSSAFWGKKLNLEFVDKVEETIGSWTWSYFLVKLITKYPEKDVCIHRT